MEIKEEISFLEINKIVICFILSSACIYQSGIHAHLKFIFLFLFFSLFILKNPVKYLKGTFTADFLLSIFLLSFSWIDYASFNSFRDRAHSLSSLIPSITLFI